MMIFTLMEGNYLKFHGQLKERCQYTDISLNTLLTISAVFNPHISTPNFLFSEV